jgi:tRNA uridine 5-carbamoylmethylation protein Kti12
MSLIITIGCPGAGKSTWADKHLPDNYLRLERDRFREALWGSRRAYHDSEMPAHTRSQVITHTMLSAMRNWPTPEWAVTDTGLAYESVQPFIYYAISQRQDVKLIVVERSADFLLTCNRIRPHAHRIPEEILLEKIGQFEDPQAWWKHSKFERLSI